MSDLEALLARSRETLDAELEESRGADLDDVAARLREDMRAPRLTAEDARAEDALAQHARAEDARAEDALAQHARAEDALAQHAPAQHAQAQHAPAQHAQAQDAAAQHTLAQDAAAQDGPVEEEPPDAAIAEPAEDAADDTRRAQRSTGELVRPRTATRWRPSRVAIAGLAAAAALLLAGLVGAEYADRTRDVASTPSVPDEALHYRVSAPGGQAAGTWLAAGDRPASVIFSDTSRVELAQGGALHITDVGPRGASFVLERGEIEASILHRDDGDWHVLAGPFRVNVRGTTFRTSRVGEVVRVEVVEGLVDIEGGCLTATRIVGTGEAVELRCPGPEEPGPEASGETAETGAAETGAAETGASETGAAETGADETGASETETVTETATHTAAQPTPTPAGDGAGLAATEEPPDLVGGEPGEPAEASASALQRATAEWRAGRAQPAAEGLRALRDEHPGTDDAAVAAYLLGRIAFDAQNDPARAERRFGDYLRERPQGALAREARGRQLEALARIPSRRADAAAAAAAYLERYPQGPRVRLARRLAGVP